MIDLHCHILAGIDDGPSHISESLEMARIAAADGIQVIAATPHIKDELHSPDKIKSLVNDLNSLLKEEQVPLEIVQGGDVYALIDPSYLKGYTINGSRYVLIEFPHQYIPKNAKDILFGLCLKGFCPIITHPERNGSVTENPDTLFDLLHDNILVQITAGSLTGDFGRDEQACARHLLRKGVVNFLATDAHSPDARRPELSKGLRIAEKILGKDQAKKLVLDNPSAVLKNMAI